MDVNEGAADYCRAVEAYLCTRNGGHLIRIVGPAFDQVCGWAARGIPLSVAFRGVDRHCERYYAKGGRRRPVRIEFCEPDVLDVFDEWRKAVGVLEVAESPVESGERPSRQRESLPAHLERLIVRLTALRGTPSQELGGVLDRTVRELDTLRAESKAARGDARAAMIERLRQLDAQLLEAARADAADGVADAAHAADLELAAFRGRMPPDAYEQSRRACIDRLLRERFGLPDVTYE
jgi:hypothetical protein